MANPDHLGRLKEGVDSWNRWRRAAPLVYPDLSALNIGDAVFPRPEDLEKLRGVGDYRDIRVNFRGANFLATTFRGSDLRGALFGRTSTEIPGAELECAILRWADFSEADLRGAYLGDTDLTGANLRGANVEGATFGATTLAGTNLSNARGLESCHHYSRSFVDNGTIAASGQLPREFFRGCGLSDEIIESVPSIQRHPNNFYSCFISYSSKDEEFARRIYSDLQNRGVRCWFAPQSVHSGQKLHEQINQAIHMHDRLLLILSEHSINSEWVNTEIAKARQREVKEGRRMLFPIRLVSFDALRRWECFDADTGKDSAREIREYFVPDFSRWADSDAYQKAFQRLLADLRT